MGSGTILREVIAAAELLAKEWGVAADIWSCPSFNELRRDGLDADRWNMLHPTEKPRKSYVESRLEGREGPVVASTDYMKAFADQIRPFMPQGKTFRVLGTDGFGRSDTREKLRHFFEVNRYWVTVAALKALADDGAVKPRRGGRCDREVRHRSRPKPNARVSRVRFLRRPWAPCRKSSSPTSGTSRASTWSRSS